MRFMAYFFGLAVLTGAVLRADSAQDIARIHVEAIGGKMRLNLLQSLRATGRVAIDGREMTFTLIAERPNRLRMETRAAGRRLIQATDGVAAPWQINPDGNEPAKTLGGDEAREFAADAEFDDPLVDAAERGYALDYAGEETAEGRRLIKLFVTRRHMDSYLLLVDAETYFIVQKRATRRRFGREAEIVTRYEDFRPVGGVILPHRYTVHADGRLLHETVMETVEPNPVVPSDSFSAPVVVVVPK